MQFRKMIGMQVASFVTLLILVAGAPTPAFIAYAEGEEPAPPVQEQAAPPQDPAPAPETTSPSETPSDDTSSTVQEQPAPSTETNSSSDSSEIPAADATGGDGGAGGDGGSGVNGGTAGDGGTGGTADATGGLTDASGGDGGAGGSGGAADGGTASDGGTGGDGGSADSNADAPEATADATGGTGGDGGTGGSGDSGSTDAAAGGDGGAGGAADSSAEGEVAGASAAGGDGGSGGNGGDGGTANIGAETSSTGGGSSNDDGGALIITGRSNAFGYLISLFNIAITNSTGDILFLRNPLGDALNFTQRIIDLFSGLATSACDFLGCSLDDAEVKLYTDNTVDVTNTLVVSSLSGENRAYSSDGTAGISTGDAGAYGGIVNFGNLQLVDSRYLILLMTNEGDLSGDILLPDGDFFKTLSSGAKIGGNTHIDLLNDAGILNNGTTTALTGDNTALSTEGSVIDTGDARAKTSVANFVNQLGAPICFVVNVSGTWNGHVIQLPEGFSDEESSFGHIICGAGGGENRGAGVSGLTASTTNYARILNDAIVEARTGTNVAEGEQAMIETGDANAFLSILNVVNQTIIGQDWIFAMFNVAGDWNGDLVFGVKPGEPDVLGAITQQLVTGPIYGQGVVGGYEPDITFTKHASIDKTSMPAKVDYEIVVDNKGGMAYQVIVNDTLKGPDGRTIGTQRWNLGALEANEKVTISYTVEFSGDLTPGYYTNTAILSGQKNLAIGLSPMMAEDVIEIVPAAEVLGVQTGPQCEPLLTQYIKPGAPNTPAQVQLLQTFLNDSEGENLEVNGIYDAATVAAVHRFQMKYATDILAPWGISKSTGNVYYTTQRKVNELYCKGESEFQLTTDQLLEISKFKAELSKPQADIDDLLKNNDVGMKKPKTNAQGPLLMPPPAIPTIFTPVSNTSNSKKPVSMMSLPLSLFQTWLFSAVPQVEAAEW